MAWETSMNIVNEKTPTSQTWSILDLFINNKNHPSGEFPEYIF